MNEILLKDEVYQIVGHGLYEKPYENAMAVEFRLKNIPCSQQLRFPVHYKDVLVSEYVPDLIAFDQIIVDTKVIERITDHERGQMLNYLKISGLELGVIINFKRARLEWERIVLTNGRTQASLS